VIHPATKELAVLMKGWLKLFGLHFRIHRYRIVCAMPCCIEDPEFEGGYAVLASIEPTGIRFRKVVGIASPDSLEVIKRKLEASHAITHRRFAKRLRRRIESAKAELTRAEAVYGLSESMWVNCAKA
jgi:hypothetical protein